MIHRPDWLSYRARDGVLETHIASDQGALAFSRFVEKAMHWSDSSDVALDSSFRFNLLDTFFSDSIPVDLLEQIFRRSTSLNPGRILLVDPTCPYADARATSIGGATCKTRSRSGLKMLAVAMQGAIRIRSIQGVSIIDLSSLDIYELAHEVHNLGLKLNIDVRFYSIVPSGPLYFFRDILLCGRFSAGSSAIDIPWAMIVDDPNCKGDQFDTMLREFEYIWAAGYDLPRQSSELAASRPDQTDSSVTTSSEVKIFISHATTDAPIANALVRCLEECLVVPEKGIRCTSLAGYRLSPGEISDETLRSNLEHCSVVIGLLTQESLKSSYVIMELGAAWGLKKTTCAVLAPDLGFSSLPGPLPRVHAVRMDRETDIASLAEEIARKAVLPIRSFTKSSAAVHTFVDSIRNVAYRIDA